MRQPADNQRRRGFTMIELLVVIAVLGLLISLIAGVAGMAVHQQKARNTQQIIQNTMLAIDQFATENPLRATYDQHGQETFGKYPPYTLANTGVGGTVASLAEPNHPIIRNDVPSSLGQRLAVDFSGASNPTVNNWAYFKVVEEPPSGYAYPDGLDDNRALAAYLGAFMPGALNLIPANAKKPLVKGSSDFINQHGTGGTPGVSPDWEDVLGIHDAWGVPLDYMLYVKLEWGLTVRGNGNEMMTWKVTERRPVLRSRGIKREVFDAWHAGFLANPRNPDRVLNSPEDWIFSETLPLPWAGMTDGPAFRQGRMPPGYIGGNNAQFNGWARLVGQAEDYSYCPDGDVVWP